MPAALVTGGGTGIGAAFARRLAADGYDLVLVAREGQRLEQVAAALRREHGVAVEVLAADLTDPAARATVEQRVADPERPIEMLVNNAGQENCGEFADVAVADLQSEIDLNVTAVLRLTHAALPAMIERGHGSVVNMASFAGYLPRRGSAYGATRSWVLALTDSVASSLAGTGVRMIAVCPGRVRTARYAADAERAGRSPLWLEPEAVVDRCLADLARGRTLSTPGLVYRTVVDVLELPRRSLRAVAQLAGRGRAQPGAATPAPTHLKLVNPAA
jgi:uncharacterized protein